MVTRSHTETDGITAPGHVRSYALSVIAAGVVIAILYWARSVFITTTTAIVIALILEPLVGLLTRWRLPRSLASFVVCLVAVTLLYFASFAAWRQLSSIASDAPAIKDHLTSLVERVSGRIQGIEDSVGRIVTPRKPAPPPQLSASSKKKTAQTRNGIPVPVLMMPPDLIPEVRIHEDRNPITDYVTSRLGDLYKIVLMASFVPFLVYFMLSWRDHIYSSFLRIFDGADRLTASRSVEGIAGMARAFVVGNFVIGLLLATVTCGIFATVRLPYPFLMGVLSGFLSLMPYIGLPLACIPPAVAALATGETTSVLLISLAAVIVLHLFAMNALYPKLVGARVHLNPLVVTLSLMVFGFLWDAAGLVLAVPITAGLKAVCDNVVALQPYGRLLGD